MTSEVWLREALLAARRGPVVHRATISTVGAKNRFPGSHLPNDLAGSEPNFRPPVFESPMIHVAFLFRELTDLNVIL